MVVFWLLQDYGGSTSFNVTFLEVLPTVLHLSRVAYRLRRGDKCQNDDGRTQLATAKSRIQRWSPGCTLVVRRHEVFKRYKNFSTIPVLNSGYI